MHTGDGVPAFRNDLLELSSSVGDRLLRDAERDSQGWYWKSMTLTRTQARFDVEWDTNGSLYSGVAGIALFLGDLYRVTSDGRYREAAKQACRWLRSYWCSLDFENGYYAGHLGACHAVTSIAKSVEDESLLEIALDMASSAKNGVGVSPAAGELLGGLAGTILGLSHLHSQTGEPWILRTIGAATDSLIGSAVLGPRGLCWDRAPDRIESLCGFAHGAAGIGFALLECGHYLQNEGLTWLAHNALLCENRWFDAVSGNCPDFRRGELFEELLENRETFVLSDWRRLQERSSETRAMVAWCHGAVGIGLSRLRAWELSGHPEYLAQVVATVAEVERELSSLSSRRDFTICHGLGGHFELLLQSSRILEREDLTEAAAAILSHAMGTRRESGGFVHGYNLPAAGEDTSLFLGSTGIAHLCLRYLLPDTIASPLSPVIGKRVGTLPAPDRAKETLLLRSPDQVWLRLGETHFPRCVSFATTNRLKRFFSAPESPDLVRALADGLAAPVLSESSSAAAPSDPEVLLELTRLRLGQAAGIGFGLVLSEGIRRANRDAVLALRDNEFRSSRLRLSRATVLERPHSGATKAEAEPSADTFWVSVATSSGVKQWELPALQGLLLGRFRRATKVRRAIEELVAHPDTDFSRDKERATRVLEKQVRDAVRCGLLEDAVR